MKTLLLIGAALSLTLSAYAGEGKKVTLDGEGLCAHCTLKSGDSCANVLQVKNDEGKLVNYILAGKAVEGKSYCKTTALSVTGTVSEKDGQMVLKATSLEIKKDKEG